MTQARALRSATSATAVITTLAICLGAVLAPCGQAEAAQPIVESSPVVSVDANQMPLAGSLEKADQISLGDSFAAGEGAKQWLDISNSKHNHCHRSANAYGLQLAAAPWTVSFHACSGAVADDYWNPNDHNKPEPPQRLWVDTATPRLKLVTITLGGNDVGFAKIVGACLLNNAAPIACEGAIKHYAKSIPELSNKLVPVYETILRTARERAWNPRVLALGYPRLFEKHPRKSCGLGTGTAGQISPDSMRALNRFVGKLNDEIAASAKEAGVGYVDVEDAFAGHGLCVDNDENRWVNRVMTGLHSYKESMHPTAKGQKAFADRVSICLAQACDGWVAIPSPDPAPEPDPPPPPPPPACQTSEATWTPGQAVVSSAGGELRPYQRDHIDLDVTEAPGWYLESSALHSGSHHTRDELRSWEHNLSGGMAWADIGHWFGGPGTVDAVFSNCPLRYPYVTQTFDVRRDSRYIYVDGDADVVHSKCCSQGSGREPLQTRWMVSVRAYGGRRGLPALHIRRTVRSGPGGLWSFGGRELPMRRFRSRRYIQVTVRSATPGVTSPPRVTMRIK